MPRSCAASARSRTAGCCRENRTGSPAATARLTPNTVIQRLADISAASAVLHRRFSQPKSGELLHSSFGNEDIFIFHIDNLCLTVQK